MVLNCYFLLFHGWFSFMEFSLVEMCWFSLLMFASYLLLCLLFRERECVCYYGALNNSWYNSVLFHQYIKVQIYWWICLGVGGQELFSVGLFCEGIRDCEFSCFVLSFKTLNFAPFDSYSLHDSIAKGASFLPIFSLRKYAFHRVPLQIFVLLNSSSDLPGYLLTIFIFRVDIIFLTVVLDWPEDQLPAFFSLPNIFSQTTFALHKASWWHGGGAWI